MTVNPSRKHLVLLGVGRANLQVLKGLAKHGAGELHATLVAPHPYYIDSAMLPGYVAGQYALDDIRVPLDGLVEASGATFVPAHVHALDPTTRRVQLSSGDALPYDVLSIDTEPVIDREQAEATMPGARRNALFVRPLETFVQLWPQLKSLSQERALQVSVIGHGIAAAELAMAAAQALARPHGTRVTLIAGEAPLLGEESPGLRRRVLNRLKQLHITLLQDRCVGMDGQVLQLQSGASLVCDAPLLAAGDNSPDWLRQAGLLHDDSGLPMVNERLQSEHHRQVFIVPEGASAEIGPMLEANLRTALFGGSFKKIPLTTSRLHVVGSGEGYAIAAWGPLSLEGSEVWQWKDRRDRRQFQALFKI
ncbi:NAD(P)/FAD-dependent oxidoreductase [Ottowia thiooxydans]|uniref:NAD(P)/FAD-dependent oxidoreductase n=1 Tax=Ottowia thiooxydans TaxID=219182 RepID=UPI0012ECB386|nr:FAD-dependent oxidoreductase [Ottowia thiooxydans]